MKFTEIRKEKYTRYLGIVMAGIIIPLGALDAKTIYVATNGSNSNSGTAVDTPLATIPAAVAKIAAGDTIYVRGGTYICTGQITLSSSGIDTVICNCLFAYAGERPLLDFSSIGTPRVSGSSDGIRLTGRYWYVKGFDIKGAPHNGIAINGGWYNRVEFCAVYENRNTGLQLSNGASYNTIINCDSYYNRDSTSTSYDGNADGFSPKLDVGSYNYFYGCRSWQNSDDGWDGYMRPKDPGTDTAVTVIENCWSFMNGYLKNGTAGTGNGNGFKMGGGDKVGGASNGDSLRHNMTLKDCLSFDNLVKGFDQNNNRGSMTLLNCTSYRNGSYNFSIPGFIRTVETVTVKNCITFGSTGVTFSGVPQAIFATNSWQPPFSGASDSDFVSLDTAGVRGSRKSDGSLPDIGFMHLREHSSFVDAGTNVGLPFEGSAPDLGAFESSPVTGFVAANTRITSFRLWQNYPNPFNPTTVIQFSVAKKDILKLAIVNILGQTVAELFAGTSEPGKLYSVQFDAGSLSSGVYFSVLSGTGQSQVRKMMLLK